MANSNEYTRQNRDRVDPQDNLFKSLEFKESRQRSLLFSVVVHGVLLSVVLLVPLIFTEVIRVKYDMVLLAPPQPKPKPVVEVTNYREPPKPKPEPKPQPKPDKPLVVPQPVKPVVVQPPPPKLPEPKVPEVKIPEVVKREELPAPVPVQPKPEVRTGTFSSASQPKPTNAPAVQVQTGGFGDPDGIRGAGKPGKTGNIASLGSFDMPAGPGAGNGTGRARGAVGNAGFGSGVANQGNGNSNRTVQQGGFGDADAAKTEGPKKRADAGPPQTSVEVLFKPKPEYTDEARQLKLEGEVLVRILFTAGGEVRVLDVVRGLGHGLDESALRAAKQIQFKPAQRDGQAVDSTATVRIVFQLAY